MVSHAELSANELAWAALDKPMLSSNAMYGPTSGLKWVVGTTSGSLASPEDEDPDFISERASDGFPGLVTKPNAADTLFTFVINKFSAPVEFDWFGILNHNLHTLSCTDLSLQVASNSSFGAGLLTVSTTNISTALTGDTRFADLVLEHGGGVARRYTDYADIRLQITCSSGVPEIGQIILGRRRQQQFAPNMPWDPTNRHSSMDDFVSRSGVINRVTRYKARREINAVFRHSTAAEQADAKAWWNDIEAGEQPWFYTDLPDSEPSQFWMMFERGQEPALEYPYTLHATRDLSIDSVEQGPNFFSLEE